MKVNLQTIATACQVSCNTVSRALRNDPKISERTRKRIIKKADELGYHRDAEISRLMTYLAKRKKGDTVYSELCYLSTFGTLADSPTHVHYYQQLKETALKYGYRVEPYYLGKGGYTPKTLQRTLYHRNVRGIILAPADPKAPLDEIDWSGYATACIGESYPKIHFNRYHWDLTWNVLECIRRVRKAGYRRMGVLNSPVNDRLMGFPVATAVAIDRRMNPSAEPLLALYDERLDQREKRTTFIGKWLEKSRPDAVVGVSSQYECIQNYGFRMPEDLGFADWMLTLWGDSVPPDISGVLPSMDTFGEEIIQSIVGRLNENFFGVPKAPSLTLIEGYWREGRTIQRQRKARKTKS